jgi:hypothetical protein
MCSLIGRWPLVACVSAVLLLIMQMNGGAQTPTDTKPEQRPDETERLQKAVQNPLANIVNVPFQYNGSFPIGPFSRTQTVLNLQPVLPFRLTENWNLVTRVIMPLASQPYLNRHEGTKNGLGDLNPSFFLSPVKHGKLIWGAGPALSLPTATNSAIGSGKWAAGPSVIGVVQPGHWTLGFLANNMWSIAGDKDRPEFNSLLLQYFVGYNFVKGWYFTSSPIITSNWKRNSDERWSVPLGGGLGRAFKNSGQSFNSQISAYYTVIHPDSLPYPKWQLRWQAAWVLPLE